MSTNPIYARMTASNFPSQSLADQYVNFISSDIAPRVKAAGALSARVVVFRDKDQKVESCESHYTWPSSDALRTYRESDIGKNIRKDVETLFGSHGITFKPESGEVALELRLESK